MYKPIIQYIEVVKGEETIAKQKELDVVEGKKDVSRAVDAYFRTLDEDILKYDYFKVEVEEVEDE